MPVTGLDHVNIVTTDLEGTKRFYKDLLGLVDGDTSSLPPGLNPNWLADPSGRSIIHLQRFDPARHAEPGGATAAVDHVALECTDFEGMQARCEALGVAYRTGLGGATFRQLLVTDPNNVRLELNFRG